MSKATYVLRQRQTRAHECHWPGCGQQVRPAMWGCSSCWFKLPADIRTAIWKSYRPGQERSMTPSTAYLAAARLAQEWIAAHFPKPPEQKRLL